MIGRRIWKLASLLRGSASPAPAGGDGRPVRVLFVCTGNACRSQMAEGWARHLKPGRLEAYSAGVSPAGLDPWAVKVMAEAGVDISGQWSKHVLEMQNRPLDWIITLCDFACEHYPPMPGAIQRFHRAFDDPPSLMRASRSEAEAIGHYRRVRDEIRHFVAGLPESLPPASDQTRPPGADLSDRSKT